MVTRRGVLAAAVATVFAGGAIAQGIGIGLGIGAKGTAIANVANGFFFDDDMDSDVDGVCDLALICDLHDQGALTLVAFTVCSSNNYAAPAARAMLDSYGRQSVPMGAWLGSGAGTSTSAYAETVRDEFRPGDVRQNYEEAYRTLRRGLLRCVNGTARIVAGGSANNLAALLASSADDISPLTGAELVALKCEWIGMSAGHFDPRTLDGSSPQEDPANVGGDRTGANAVAAFTGCPVRFFPLTLADNVEDPDNIVTDTLRSRIRLGADPATDAAKRAYNLGVAQHDGAGYRMAVTTPAFWFAAYGLETHFEWSELGTLSFSAGAPYTNWTASGAGNVRYLKKLSGQDAILTKRNEYACFRVGTVHTASYIANGFMSACRFEYQLGDGASATTQVLTDTSGNARHGERGLDSSATTTDPTWVAEGLDFDGSNDSASAPAFAIGADGAVFAAVTRPDTLSGTDQILTRGTSTSQAQMRYVSGVLQYVRPGPSGTSTIVDASGASSTGVWQMNVAKVDLLEVRLRRNGADVGTGTTLDQFPTQNEAYRIGNRTSQTEYFDGRMAYVGVFGRLLDTDLPLLEARIRAIVAARSISV